MLDALHRILTGHDDAERPNGITALLPLRTRTSKLSAATITSTIARRVSSSALWALRFVLASSEVTRLVKAAEGSAVQANDLFHFTRWT
jgi:hypothetical protein